ncbi:SCO family protein [Deinococcus peraridilitoris]|uniref:Uncharacterized protein SCO1/SenC/PrrC, involved in biogenesis of respiratory and photosynthetic systems n=1 Tax=Deinococcus peraridilitoris (strain DSM 19664 / LMG 22246 / CIP 109416 / KR-200) TaxID=937777 RepID=U3GLC5_DEIPD|nr:SCO family protein [Deinococcus peraridilitoris]AFZ68257.1 uncharacterized protein SCO1/SenC/PrrC, involved in biogenesis of respiratory and photosynthetic systems [Deinococcus peraridilitoris DSM 19664]
MNGESISKAASPWPKRLTLALLALALVLAGIWLYQRQTAPGTTPAVYTPSTGDDGPPAATRFTAVDQEGRPYTFAAETGNVNVLFFGFTHCPDVCPLTLSYLAKARAELPEALQKRVNLVFLSVDPARDTPSRLKEYVEFFSPDIVGLHLNEPTLGEVAKAYDIQYSKGEVQAAGKYQILHNSSTFLIDKENRMRLMYAEVPSVQRLAQDMRDALDE